MRIIANTFGERPVLNFMYAAITSAKRPGEDGVSASEKRQLDAAHEELDEAHRRRQRLLSAHGRRKSPRSISGKDRP